MPSTKVVSSSPKTSSKARAAAASAGLSKGNSVGSSVTASQTRAHRPAWMNCRELSQAMADVEPQLGSLRETAADQLKSVTRSWLKREISFISNAEFAQPGVGAEIFSAELDLAPSRTELGISAIRRSGIDMPIHLSRLCEAALLTPAQERILFMRMNFLLQQAAMHRDLLSADRPSRARLELIERLVALADWHRDRIVEANLRLVFSIVKKFVNPNNSFDELLSDGIVGLMRAVEKFDFDRGFRFSTYATQVVRRNSYRTVVVNQQERQRVLGGLQDMDIEPSDEQKTSAISEKRWTQLRRRLSTMLDDLDRREKLIIRSRFALGSHRQVRTLQALADRLGISKERVRQLEKRAMEKLQAMASDPQMADF